MIERSFDFIDKENNKVYRFKETHSFICVDENGAEVDYWETFYKFLETQEE